MLTSKSNRNLSFMKKIIISLFVILLVFSVVACSQESTDEELTIDIGDSTKFTEEEIDDAIKVIMDNFAFEASILTKISYNEEESNRLITIYIEDGRGSVNGVSPENIIVLLTNFDVDDSGDNPVLNPGSTYEDYQWILIRDDKTSKWNIDDFGY